MAVLLKVDAEHALGSSKLFYKKAYYIDKKKQQKETVFIFIGHGIVGEDEKKYVIIGIEKDEKNGITLWCCEVLIRLLTTFDVDFLRKTWKN